MELHKLAEKLNKKYINKFAESSDIQQIVNVMRNYESMSEFLGTFVSALDVYAELAIKDFDPIENAEDIDAIQKQMQIIEGSINSIINQVAELDGEWSSDFKG